MDFRHNNDFEGDPVRARYRVIAVWFETPDYELQTGGKGRSTPLLSGAGECCGPPDPGLGAATAETLVSTARPVGACPLRRREMRIRAKVHDRQ